MIRALDIISFLLAEGYVFIFFWTLRTFLSLRKSWFIKIIAYIIFSFIADAIIYSNDLDSLLGTLLSLFLYILVFYRGTLMEKISALLVFYPVLISVNYLMMDIGSRLFFTEVRAGGGEAGQSAELLLLSTAIHTVSLLLRFIFWIGIWLLLRKILPKIASHITIRMWVVIDAVMLASFVAVFTIIYFMPRDVAIVYPICGASIFSSFGCMYLAAYICDAMQNAYRIQELEMQSNYYKDRVRDEERVRSIYHDLKNHLLILQSDSRDEQMTKQSFQTLQEQIEGYENYHHTGSEVLDIILRDKAKRAQEKQIDFSAAVSFEDGGFIDPLDISTIFGNALDNAIEASEKLLEEQRLITVKAGRVRDMLFITVANNTLFTGDVSGAVPEGTTKKDSFIHGFGLPNIRKAVERYEGQCNISSEKGVFTLKIVIPVP